MKLKAFLPVDDTPYSVASHLAFDESVMPIFDDNITQNGRFVVPEFPVEVHLPCYSLVEQALIADKLSWEDPIVLREARILLAKSDEEFEDYRKSMMTSEITRTTHVMQEVISREKTFHFQVANEKESNRKKRPPRHRTTDFDPHQFEDDAPNTVGKPKGTENRAANEFAAKRPKATFSSKKPASPQVAIGREPNCVRSYWETNAKFTTLKRALQAICFGYD
ncbi:hypothetical protein SBOR_6411 [Sclerotinia borealis F-4128]|uniref:Uncharacterized protein n=1 Tax=Sclerotinia borealis (strain F-4128) TaxID=1432307 RepID=W9CF93_SCLBF|nr:hypothetical protein SBOR_6411 [Sclerotinia borealis F-4128]